MEQLFSEISFQTNGQGFLDITNKARLTVEESKIRNGIIVISTKHTSCSLIVSENADPRVLIDLSEYMNSIVPENSFLSLDGERKRKKYLHSEEGPDDMPAHIKSVLTCTSLTLSVSDSHLILGTWQAIYLWEHRYNSNHRKLIFHILGTSI